MIIEDSSAGEIFLLWLWSSLTACPDREEQNKNPTGLRRGYCQSKHDCYNNTRLRERCEICTYRSLGAFVNLIPKNKPFSLQPAV